MSTNNIIAQLETEQMGKELPEFGPGDTVVVQVKVKEVLASVCRPLKEFVSASATAL
jgi:ribosomal protein L19